LDSFSVRSNPLEFKINQGVGFGEEIEFEVSIIANGYSKKQYFSRIINSDFLTIEENNLTVTATSDGGMGYTGSSREIGEGIRYKNGNSLLWDGSLLIGSQNNFIANKFRGENGNDDDFVTQEVIRPTTAKRADFETYSSSTFTSSTNDGLKVENKCYVFKDNKAQNSIIYEYKITNTGTVNYTDLYAGLILDWDILNYDRNKIGYDSDRQMGVSYSTDSSLYCGVRVLAGDSTLSTTHYAIDNSSNSGDINLSDGFTDAEKIQVLSTNKQIAGATSPQGVDVIDVNSVGPVALASGSHFYVSFLITVSDSLNGLQTESDTLKNLYERIVISARDAELVSLNNSLKVFPNPTSGNLNLELKLAKQESLQISIYNLQGSKVYTLEEKSFNRGKNRISLNNPYLNTGIYFIKVEGEGLLFQQKFVVVR